MTAFSFCVRRAPFSLALILSLLPVLAAPAQTLAGRVLDEDRAALPGATVTIETPKRLTVTDEAGRYQIEGVSPDSVTVVFSYVGYETAVRNVLIRPTGTTILNVVLVESAFETDEVVVHGDREAADLTVSSGSVATLGESELQKMRGQTLGETLKNVPGVTTLQTGPSVSKPVIRGLHSERVVVLNAGVPQEGQQWGGEHGPEIDPFAPSEIQVVRGAASVEYGAGAIGGVVRLEPRPLPAEPGLGGSLMLNTFSNNGQGAASLLLEGGLPGLKGWGWRAQGTFRKAGDARTADYVVGNSAFEERNGSLALGYHSRRLGVEGYYSRFSTDLGIYRGAHIGNLEDLMRAIERGRPLQEYRFSYKIGRPKQTVAHDLATARFHYDVGGGAGLDAQYGFQQNHRMEYDAHRPYNDSLAALDRPSFELVLHTHTADVKLQHRPLTGILGGAAVGRVGVSGMGQKNTNRRAGYLIPNFVAYTGGLYAIETWVSGAWTVEAGARYDYRWQEALPREFGSRGDVIRRTETYSSLSGVAGAIWKFAHHWSAAVHLGTGWRAPSVNELYSFGVHHGTAQFEAGNAGLTSERSVDTDFTLRHEDEHSRFEVSLFNNRISDYIYLFPDAEPRVTIRGVFPSFHYDQTDAVLRGFDGSVEYQPFRPLTVGATLSVVRGTNLANGEPLIAMPADRLTLRGALGLPRVGRTQETELEVEGVFVRRQDRYPAHSDYAAPPAGYGLVNLQLSTELRVGAAPAHLSFAVQNFFNTRYRDYLSRFRYFIDDPGRNFVVRLEIPLNG